MTAHTFTIAAVLAGGSGTRVGGEVPKQLLLLGGRTVLEHSIAAFDGHPCIDVVVVVCREDLIPTVQDLVARAGFRKVRGVIPGGPARSDSSLAAIRFAEALVAETVPHTGHAHAAIASPDAAPCHFDQSPEGCVEKSTACILLHDAARPLVDAGVISRCLEALETYDAVEPAIPVSDTIIRVDGTGLLADVPPRNTLRAVQTPQAFRLSILSEAYRRAFDEAASPAVHSPCQDVSAPATALEAASCHFDRGPDAASCHFDRGPDAATCHFDQGPEGCVEKSPVSTQTVPSAPVQAPTSAAFTDDISVVRRFLPEVPVKVVDGSPRNLKLTYPSDIPVFEALL